MTWATCLVIGLGLFVILVAVYCAGYSKGMDDHAKQTRVTAPTGADYRNVIAMRNYNTLRGKRWSS